MVVDEVVGVNKGAAGQELLLLNGIPSHPKQASAPEHTKHRSHLQEKVHKSIIGVCSTLICPIVTGQSASMLLFCQTMVLYVRE